LAPAVTGGGIASAGSAGLKPCLSRLKQGWLDHPTGVAALATIGACLRASVFRPRERSAPVTVIDPSATPIEPPDPVPRLPVWARLADTLTLAIVALWLRIAVIAPVRFRVGDVRVTATSLWRVGAVIALVILVRHMRWRRPGLHRRIAGVVGRWWRAPNARAVLAGAAVSRTAVLLAGLVAVSAFGVPRGMSHITNDSVRNIVDRWDAGWYHRIAERGYEWEPDGQQHSVAFFPALPVAMAILAAILRWHVLHAGLLLSMIAFLVAASYLYGLARESLDPERALAAVWLLAAYPFSVYYSAPYTESLYLLAVLATLYHFGRDEWGRAAVWGAIAGLSRPNGCLLSVVLAIVMLTDMWRAPREGRPENIRRRVVQLAVASCPGLGMVAFTAYLYARFGVALLWMQTHGAWGRTYTSVVDLTVTRATSLQEHGLVASLFSQPYEAMNTGAAVFGLLMIVPVWRRLGVAYAAFVALSLLPPLVMGGTTSIARLTSTLFPIFILLAAWSTPAWRMGLLAVFGILQGLVAALFFTWRPMY
jgi:hypothetical protein